RRRVYSPVAVGRGGARHPRVGVRAVRSGAAGDADGAAARPGAAHGAHSLDVSDGDGAVLDLRRIAAPETLARPAEAEPRRRHHADEAVERAAAAPGAPPGPQHS